MRELILIVGRTGAGKSTIARKLADMFKRPIVKSYTTRPMREGETEETADHIFIDAKDVALYSDDFAAYTKIGDYEYFITWSLLEDYASKGAIYVIDPVGVWNLQKSLKDAGKEMDLNILYIKANEETRMNRLRMRGDDEIEIEKRLMAEADQFDEFERRIDDGYEKVLIINNSEDDENLIRYKKPFIHPLSARLLTTKEAETLLSEEDRKYNNWWWLRSPGNLQDYAANVYIDGSVDDFGNYVGFANFCVRPALIINLKFSDYTIGDTFTFDDKPFKIISDELAFCLEDIGQCCFRKDDNASDANDYEKSDVKKFVDQWFKEAKQNA